MRHSFYPIKKLHVSRHIRVHKYVPLLHNLLIKHLRFLFERNLWKELWSNFRQRLSEEKKTTTQKEIYSPWDKWQKCSRFPFFKCWHKFQNFRTFLPIFFLDIRGKNFSPQIFPCKKIANVIAVEDGGDAWSPASFSPCPFWSRQF